MADYYMPTVVQQTIPNADMTPLERLLLCSIFESDTDGDGLYFHHWEGPSDMIWMSHSELETALAASLTADSVINAWVTAQLEKFAREENSAGLDEVELDLSDIWYPSIFQNIIKRSATLRFVSITTSFTCSKMRDDGFGGMAIFITADVIKSQSTNEFLEDCIGEIEGDSSDEAQPNIDTCGATQGEAGDGSGTCHE